MPAADSRGSEFIESVLDRHPRLAVFDCDGTLWAGDAGEDFFYWSIDHGLVPQSLARPAIHRYVQYKKGHIGEAQMCGEMVTLYEGMEVATLEHAADDFFEAAVEKRIFAEMQELARLLEKAGCQMWAVSSTNEWVVQSGAERFGIPGERVLAASAMIEDGLVTGRLRRVPTGEDKARAIRKEIVSEVDAAFGNSIHDAAMLSLATHAYAIAPTPELGQIASAHGWQVYVPRAVTQ